MESKKFGTGGNVNYTYGGKGQINKQRTRGGSIYGVQKNIPNENLNKYVGKKAGGEVKHEDIKMDKKVVKKAVAMHDKQLHGGKKTDLKGLKKGGTTTKTKRMFGGGMGMASGMGAGRTPAPSATNAAGNAAIGRATGITPPTGGPRGSAPTPPSAITNNPNVQRMQQTISDMRSGAGKAQAAGRTPARQMGSVPAPKSTMANAVRGAVAAPTSSIANTVRGAAKGANPLAGKKAPSQGRAPARQMGSVQRQQLAPGATPPPRGVNPALAGKTNPNPLAGKKAPSQGRRMASGGLAAGHKSADGIAKKGKTKGTEVKMARGGKTKKYC